MLITESNQVTVILDLTVFGLKVIQNVSMEPLSELRGHPVLHSGNVFEIYRKIIFQLKNLLLIVGRQNRK